MEPRIVRTGSAFRDCVRECAVDEKIVSAFNRQYCANLKAPIEILLRDPEEGDLDPDNEMHQQIAYFILFVHTHVWTRVRQAQSRVIKSLGSSTGDLLRSELSKEMDATYGRAKLSRSAS